MAVLQRILDRFLKESAPFYDSLREDRFFLVSYLIGSYLVIQNIVNAAIGTYVSIPTFLLGTVTLLGGTLKRLTDLELARIHRADTDGGGA